LSWFEGFVDKFRRNSAESPDHRAVVFCHTAAAGDAEDSLSYIALDRAARSSAAGLQARCQPGDRVLLLYPQGLEFVRSFLGCLYAGVLPVVAPPPGGHRHQVARTAGIVLDCGASLVLTDGETLPSVSAWLNEADSGHVACIATDIAEPADPDAWVRPDTDGSAVAFLQYTSGSVSAPKGVMISHANLVHNLTMMADTHDCGSDTTFCNWIPMFHDMGLVFTLLTPLFVGSTAIQLSATAFLKRPHRWLELIDRHGAVIAAAPNFAYDLCARRLTDEQIGRLDLSRWRCAVNGSEPINPDTLARFAERFAAAGFRHQAFAPGYGMAETTLCVSATGMSRPPTLLRVDPGALEQNALRPALPGEGGSTLVGCGTVGHLDVRIVGPATREPLPDGRIGEVWIRGGSVAQGYWGKPGETRRTFRAVTAGGDGGFLRTGDLGAFRDGELYITGRIKEMLIIHGRNLYPQDIEREIKTLDTAFADRPASVFSVPVRQEEIVVVQELRPAGRRGDDLLGLARSVKMSIGQRLGVRVANVVFVRPGQVRKTTSGKIQRTLMRELFMTDALESLYEDLDAGTRGRYRTAKAAGPALSGAALSGAALSGAVARRSA